MVRASTSIVMLRQGHLILCLSRSPARAQPQLSRLCEFSLCISAFNAATRSSLSEGIMR